MELFSNPAIGPLFELAADDSVGSGVSVSVSVSGISATSSVGSVSVTADISAALVGLSATSFIGGVAVVTDGGTNIAVSGLSAIASIGSVSIIINFVNATVLPIGLTGTGFLGTILASFAVPRTFAAGTADLAAVIHDLVVEDDYDLIRSIGSIPSGATLVDAWLTVKGLESDTDAAAIVQKHITVDASSDGQILDDGTNNPGSGQVLFQLTYAETDLFTPERSYYYDIQVKTSTGKYSTREKGVLIPVGQITQAL